MNDYTCRECFNNFEGDSSFNLIYNRCDRCIDLKHWDCKECGCSITVVEYDRNNGKCNNCR